MAFLSPTLPFLLLSAFLLGLSHVNGHAVMTVPRARGALNQNLFSGLPWVVTAAQPDYCLHCHNANARAATGPWRPFEPLNKKVPFRRDFGMCGDKVDAAKPRDHEKGGVFSAPASFPYSAVYKAGSVVQFEVGISTSHQGFFEFFVCDIGKCGADISEKCFKRGHCRLLERAPNAECDSGKSKYCGPKDPAYPGRWVMPCDPQREPGNSGMGTYFLGGKHMTYQLPAGFDCKDCVIQWYWATANSCNPPGFSEYFEKFPMKAWEGCPGDGGTTGGVDMSKVKCGESKPEEFWNCADVRITSDSVQPPDYSSKIEYMKRMHGKSETSTYGRVLSVLMGGSDGDASPATLPRGDEKDGRREDAGSEEVDDVSAGEAGNAGIGQSSRPEPSQVVAPEGRTGGDDTNKEAYPANDNIEVKKDENAADASAEEQSAFSTPTRTPQAHRTRGCALPFDKKARPEMFQARHSPRYATQGHVQASPPPVPRNATPPLRRVQGEAPAGACVGTWRQCGGIGYNGPSRCCGAGERCVELSPYYFQCKRLE